jgi:hypothetical protein
MKLNGLKWFAGVMAVVLTSCITDDKLGGEPEEPTSEMLTIAIAVPGNTLPATRALEAGDPVNPANPATRALTTDDEYAVSEVAVLAFNTVNGDKKFYGRYAGKIASGDPTGTGTGAAATMTFEVSLPIGEFDLMVVTGAGAMLDAAQAAGKLNRGEAQNMVLEALQMAMPTGGWVDNTNATGYRPIPMWGYKTAVKVPESFTGTGASTSLANPIPLTRMLAKVDVQLSTALLSQSKFTLQSVRVYKYAEQGRLVPDIGDATKSAFWEGITQTTLASLTVPTIPSIPSWADPTSEFIDRTSGDGKSILNSIYLFESPVGMDLSSPTNFTPSLVIGGSYNGGPTSYYRVDLAKDTDTNPNDDVHNWEYIPVLRNHAYTITINDVIGDGHASQADALDSAPANMNTSIFDWTNGDIRIATTNGLYLLGVSTDEVILPPGQHNATSTYNKLTIVTDYSGGWTAKVWDDEAGTIATASTWLKLSADTHAKDAPAGTEVSLLASTITSNQREAWVHIKAGVLTLKVHVLKYEGYIFDHGEETWFAQIEDMGPYIYNAIGACPAGYDRPTLAVAESMRTQVPLVTGRDYWSSEIVATTTPATPTTKPAEEGTLAWTGEVNVTSGAYNLNTTTLPKKHGASKSFVYTSILTPIDLDEVTNEGNHQNNSVISIVLPPQILVSTPTWKTSLNIYTRIIYGRWLDQWSNVDYSQYPLFMAAFDKLSPETGRGRYEWRGQYSGASGFMVSSVNWTQGTTNHTASAYVRCVKRLK